MRLRVDWWPSTQQPLGHTGDHQSNRGDGTCTEYAIRAQMLCVGNELEAHARDIELPNCAARPGDAAMIINKNCQIYIRTT